MKATAIAGAALFVAVLLCYLPSLRNGFIYDDHRLILQQAAPASSADYARVFAEPHYPDLPYYRPATRLTFLIQKAVHGDNPIPFHLFNAALMAAAGVLVFGLLRGAPFRLHDPLAGLAALLFALHPLASSCVYPAASGRETLWPAFWMLGALYAHLRAGTAWRATALICFIVALFSKEQAVVLPLALAAADILGLSADPPGRRTSEWLARYAPMAAAAAIYLAVRHAMFAGNLPLGLAVLQDPLGPGLSYAYALQVIFAPTVRLAYEPPVDVWFSPVRLGIAILASGALLWLAFGRGSAGRKISCFWIVWFVVLQLPTANLLRQEAEFDERYVFLAVLAIPALLAAWVRVRWERQAFRRACVGVGGVAVALCAWMSVQRAADFRDDPAFFRRWTQSSPSSGRAHYYLGTTLADMGRDEEAVRLLLLAVWLQPDLVEARYNLGNIFLRQNDFWDAIGQYRHALGFAPRNAKFLNNLGVALIQVDRTEEAAQCLRKALRIEPGYADAHNNLGVAMERMGRLDEALAQFEAAARLDPSRPEFRGNVRRLSGP